MSPHKWISMVLFPDVFEEHWQRVRQLATFGKQAIEQSVKFYAKVTIYGLLCLQRGLDHDLILCFFSFLWSVLVCILLCSPTQTCLCIWGERSKGNQPQTQPSHRLGGPTPFHHVFWALGYSCQPAKLGVWVGGPLILVGSLCYPQEANCKFDKSLNTLTQVMRARKLNVEDPSADALKDTWACLTLRFQCRS
jgi:hypothetical protein